MTLIVAVDFDGVMYPFPRAMAEWSASTGGPVLPEVPTSMRYWKEAGVSDDEWEALLSAFGEAGGYRSEAPDPDALEGVTALFDAGCDLLGVTSRPASRVVVTSTYGWVGDWMLPLRAVLIGPNAKLEAECDMVIDDDPATLDALADLGEAVGILLDRPWNQDTDHPRATWEELPVLVGALADAVAGAPEAERKWDLADTLADFLG